MCYKNLFYIFYTREIRHDEMRKIFVFIAQILIKGSQIFVTKHVLTI